MFSRGYILGPIADWFWFLTFPLLAVGIALACHRWLPVMALASIGLWITIPHHLSTWMRTYGLREDWQRWKQPLIFGPPVIISTTFLGLLWAPNTLLLLTLIWDHQHSLMQQHGLARIYDYKAHTGTAATGRYDLILHCLLYGNMLITAPLFFRLWGAEIYRWQLPVTPELLAWIHYLSWGTLTVFLVIYAGHLWVSARAGNKINPIKYLFVTSSYFLWYFTSWQTDSLLVFGIAHRLMHGVQYMVIVNSYLVRKGAHERRYSLFKPASDSPATSPLGANESFAQSRHGFVFVGLAIAYVLGYQLLLLRPLDELGFGVVSFMAVGPQPRPGMNDPSQAAAYDLFAMTLIQALPVTHYYFDSFVWKVSDVKVQQGL